MKRRNPWTHPADFDTQRVFFPLSGHPGWESWMDPSGNAMIARRGGWTVATAGGDRWSVTSPTGKRRTVARFETAIRAASGPKQNPRRKREHPIAAAQRLGEQFHRWQGAGLRKAVRLVMPKGMIRKNNPSEAPKIEPRFHVYDGDRDLYTDDKSEVDAFLSKHPDCTILKWRPSLSGGHYGVISDYYSRSNPRSNPAGWQGNPRRGPVRKRPPKTVPFNPRATRAKRRNPEAVPIASGLIVNPRRNPAHAVPVIKRFTYVGTSDEVDACDCCGKSDLKSTVAIQDNDSGETLYFGTTCAARALKQTVKEVKAGTAAADRAKAEAARKVQQAKYDAEMKDWGAYLVAKTGGIRETYGQREWVRDPITGEERMQYPLNIGAMIQALGGFKAAREGFATWTPKQNPRRRR
jgi:hypothetical protein